MQINVDLIYPIGSLYLTTSTVSPAVLFGGTWERISDDAYLKIATGSTAGNLDGTSSDHKIPLTSIPSHTHGGWNHGFWNDKTTASDQWGNYPITLHADKKANWTDYNTKSAGGGNPYYPYYYDVFVWKRIA